MFDNFHKRTRAFASLWRVVGALGTISLAASGSAPIAAAAPTSFYVDCDGGNDGNTGTDASAAWSTLERANRADLHAGDTLALKRGCDFRGGLKAGWNGTADQPVVIASYGQGDQPTVEATNESITLAGSYTTVDGLNFHGTPDRFDPGCGNQAVGYRVGVQISKGAHHNTVRNSSFSSLSMGVFVGGGATNNTIQKNSFDNVDMMFTLTPRDQSNWDDGGAQAILLEGDYNEVSYNMVLNSRACSYDFTTDGAVVEVFGGGHNTVHHNYAENSDIFAEVSEPQAVDNAFSYNIANGHRGLTVKSETNGTKVYNSVFYSTGGNGDNGIVCGNCNAGRLTFKNNIVWASGALSTNGSGADEGYNVYWASNGSPYLDGPISGTSVVADPKFEAPGSDFRLQADSPAIDAGTTESVVAGFVTDLDGRAVPGNTDGVEEGTYAF